MSVEVHQRSLSSKRSRQRNPHEKSNKAEIKLTKDSNTTRAQLKDVILRMFLLDVEIVVVQRSVEAGDEYRRTR